MRALRDQLESHAEHNTLLLMESGEHRQSSAKAEALEKENAMLRAQMKAVEDQKTVLNKRNVRLAAILEKNSIDVHGEERGVLEAEEAAVKEAYRRELEFQEQQRRAAEEAPKP